MLLYTIIFYKLLKKISNPSNPINVYKALVTCSVVSKGQSTFSTEILIVPKQASHTINENVRHKSLIRCDIKKFTKSLMECLADSQNAMTTFTCILQLSISDIRNVF